MEREEPLIEPIRKGIIRVDVHDDNTFSVTYGRDEPEGVKHVDMGDNMVMFGNAKECSSFEDVSTIGVDMEHRQVMVEGTKVEYGQKYVETKLGVFENPDF